MTSMDINNFMLCPTLLCYFVTSCNNITLMSNFNFMNSTTFMLA